MPGAKKKKKKKKAPPPGIPLPPTSKSERDAIAAVQKRKEERRLRMIDDQRKQLTPKLGEKMWETVKISSGSKERVETEMMSGGVVMYEFEDSHGIKVDLRFFPYNAISGEFRQESLGVMPKGERTKGELVVKDAGKLTFIFENPGGWFGKKSIKFRFVHASDLPAEVLEDQGESYAPQDVWWARRDPKTRKVYYINKHLKKTSWKIPPGAYIANARFAKDSKAIMKQKGVVSAQDEHGDDGEGEEVHVNEYQQKMNSITKGATMADLPPPLTGWFLKANRKGKVQSRFFRLERQYLHYYPNETAFHNDEECKDPMDLYSVIGTKVPSTNEGFDDFKMTGVEDLPFDLFTREKYLSLAPDKSWFKGKVVTVHSGGLYDIHYDNGDNEEKVPAKLMRKEGEKEIKEGQTFKKGMRVEKQKNLQKSRTLARVLKTWKPRIMSGWFMKVNRRGRQQKRWFHLLGSKLSYFQSPQDLKQKKQPIDLEFLDNVVNPSRRIANASKIGAFDIIIATGKNIPQTLDEKQKAMEENERLEKKGVDEKKLAFQTLTLYPAQRDPSTKSLVQILNDWQTHDELRFNKDKVNILKCRIRAHPATAFGVVVTDVEPYQVKTGYPGHTEQGVRITQLLSLPNGDLGPAEAAGVMLNDTLVDIDGIPVSRVQDAAKALKGKQSALFNLCRLGDVSPEHINRMKRTMMNKEELEAEKTFKAKGKAVKRRKSVAARMEAQRMEHRHRRHRGKKAVFGPTKHRAGWRQSTNGEGRIYWFHTDGSFTYKQPPKSEILETMLTTVVVQSYSTTTKTTTTTRTYSSTKESD